MPQAQSDIVILHRAEEQKKALRALKENVEAQLQALHAHKASISSQMPTLTHFGKQYGKPKSLFDKMANGYVAKHWWQQLLAVSLFTGLTAAFCVLFHYSIYFSLVSTTIYTLAHALMNNHGHLRCTQFKQLTHDLQAIDDIMSAELERLNNTEQQLKVALDSLFQYQLLMIKTLKQHEQLQIIFEKKLKILHQQNQELTDEKNTLMRLREQLQQQVKDVETQHAKAVQTIKRMGETLAKREQDLALVNSKFKNQGLKLANILKTYRARIKALEEVKQLFCEALQELNQQDISNIDSEADCDAFLAQSETVSREANAHIETIQAFIAERLHEAPGGMHLSLGPRH